MYKYKCIHAYKDIYIYNERAQNKSDRIHTTVEYAGKFFIQKKREREINFSC